MIFEAQMVDTSRKNEFQVMHECVEQAVLAEKMGFDKVWAVEHHCLKWYAHMSAPETFLAYVAGKTERIRIGHGVVCLPFRMNHPVKVAERVAMLDILSKGRVEFGIGKGGTPQEAGAFQTEIADIPPQLEEAARMIPKMWSEEYFEHHSETFELPPRPIIPKPYQDPHPPMYMASIREESLEQAGRWGLGALVLGFGGPEEIARKNAIYRAAVKERTEESQIPDFPVEHLSALCPAIVLDDDDRARAIGHRGQRFFTESINHWYAPGAPEPRGEIAEMSDEEALEQASAELVKYFREHEMEVTRQSTEIYNPNHAYGNVDAAIGYVERLVEAGADEIMFLIQMGTVPQEAALETITNIGEKVIPHFRR
jgi:alkanesulfonate monooxygenase SsuD/methylene tetrahydromethanopterin reductase-like flavin-dependent oxidoreductase (luciferase family)